MGNPIWQPPGLASGLGVCWREQSVQGAGSNVLDMDTLTLMYHHPDTITYRSGHF